MVSSGREVRSPSKVPFEQPRAACRAFDLVVPELACQPVAFVESVHAHTAPRPVNAYSKALTVCAPETTGRRGIRR